MQLALISNQLQILSSDVLPEKLQIQEMMKKVDILQYITALPCSSVCIPCQYYRSNIVAVCLQIVIDPRQIDPMPRVTNLIAILHTSYQPITYLGSKLIGFVW